MSQRALEAALGKLICDDGFRREFYEDAEGAVARAGFLLTPVELSSLYKIDIEAIETFVSHVDDRVRRAEADSKGRRPKPLRHAR
jgi:hypothetical protein